MNHSQQSKLRLLIVILVGIFGIVGTSNTAKSQNAHEYTSQPSLSVSGDGAMLAISGRVLQDETARMGFRYPVDFFDTQTGEFITPYEGNEDSLVDVSLNYDGTLLAFNDSLGRLAVVNVENGSEVTQIKTGGFTDVGYPVWKPNADVIAFFQGISVEIQTIEPRQRLQNYNDAVATPSPIKQRNGQMSKREYC